MNQQQRRFVAIAIVIGAAVYWMMAMKKQPSAGGGGGQATPAATPTAPPTPLITMQACLFAKRDLPRFTRITRENVPMLLDRRDVDSKLIPPGAATELVQAAGMIVVDDIHRREPILLSRLARPEEVMGIAHHIAPGKRAVSVRVESVRAVGGFVGQGDIVDLVGTFTVPANLTGVGGTLTRFVMQRVKILAINTLYEIPKPAGPEGASPSPGGAAPAPSPVGTPQDMVTSQQVQMVTFEVTPEEAEKLVLISEQARLYLVLRSPLDEEEVKVDPIDDEQVYIDRTRKPPIPKRDIVIYKGRTPQIISVKVESLPRGALATDVYYQDQEPIIAKPRPEDFQMLSPGPEGQGEH